jgi:hypothetical protein
MPVIVFFDEMDSIFRTRGSGVSSDVENTIVPQLLSEIDGVEGLENVIVIGASNREDMIDPAILRPGRLDVKIKIERPDAEAAKDIFSKYVLTVLPLHPDDVAENGGSSQATVDAMILRTVERMYTESEENRFLEVTYANGDQVTYANGNKEVLYFNDFNSRWLHGLNRVLISTFASICSGWSPPRRRLFQAKPGASEGASVAAPGCAGDGRLGPPQLWMRSSRSVCSYTRSWASWSRDFLDDFLSSAEL